MSSAALRSGVSNVTSVTNALSKRMIGSRNIVRAISTTSPVYGFKSGTSKPNVAVVGATGAVGIEFLRCLSERKFPMNELTLLASARSAGKTLKYEGNDISVQELTPQNLSHVDIALFSAGGSTSRAFANAAVQQGAVVIDNSSAFRMAQGVPLVVPEVNPEAAHEHKGIIANPNCSTIIMATAVYPIFKAAGVERMVVSTYQAASGAGAAAMQELEQQARDWSEGRSLKTPIFGRQYLWNLFSHNSAIGNDGYNEEETKMIRETRKIFKDDNIRITATCVRVPVLRAHCEAINLSLRSPLTEEDVRKILEDAPGVKIVDDRQSNSFPEPIMASGKDEILVGRIRPDVSQPKDMGYELFVAGDQLLKGAALNAVQIAELLV